MFNSILDIVEQCNNKNIKIYQLMLEQEAQKTERTQNDIIASMSYNYIVMKNAVAQGIKGVTSHSGLCGNDAKRIWDYIQKGSCISDTTLLKAVCYAIATNEVNASMGIICATPTAGSSGVLPGVLIAMQEKYGFSDDKIIKHMFTAGAIGYVIANNASISGAAGGCQAEIGSASAMTAACLTELLGGSPKQAAHAMAMALKNMLGLACDPLAGLVEVPCIKRNGSGASNAVIACELALAGVESKVPWDEVIHSMYRIGLVMPATLKETSLGGLATSSTGEAWKKKIWKI